MIDHLIRFDSEADALADPVLAPYRSGAVFDQSRVIAGVKVWQPANDTVDGDVVSHDYLPYFYLMIGLPALDEALRNHPACMLVADRDKANAGEPFVVYSPLPIEALAEYALEPSFAGSGYPFGSLE